MSFFSDFLNELKVVDEKNVSISLILGVAVYIVGDFKIDDFSKEKIVIYYNKKIINILGEDLNIKSISKGEMIAVGNVKSVSLGE